MKVLFTSLLALLALVPAVAQTEQLVSQHPALRAAIDEFVRNQPLDGDATKGAQPIMAAASSPVNGGGIQQPSVTLVLNRQQFEPGQQLQATLKVSSWGYIQRARIVRAMLNMDTGYSRVSSKFMTLQPGDTIPVQDYIFDGTEPFGMYAYSITIYDAYTRQMVAMPGTSFVLGYFGRSDSLGYVRIDFAEQGGRYLFLRGNFASELSPLQQFVAIDGRLFPVFKTSATVAVADLGYENTIASGVHDLTLLVWNPVNVAYDSTTLQGGLKIFLPRGTTPTPPPSTPQPPTPQPPPPPPGKG